MIYKDDGGRQEQRNRKFLVRRTSNRTAQNLCVRTIPRVSFINLKHTYIHTLGFFPRVVAPSNSDTRRESLDCDEYFFECPSAYSNQRVSPAVVGRTMAYKSDNSRIDTIAPGVSFSKTCPVPVIHNRRLTMPPGHPLPEAEPTTLMSCRFDCLLTNHSVAMAADFFGRCSCCRRSFHSCSVQESVICNSRPIRSSVCLIHMTISARDLLVNENSRVFLLGVFR